MGKDNEIIGNYRDNKIMRNEFHNFISIVFPSISFKKWYSEGFWTEHYIPYSITRSGKIISNASATFMDIIFNEKKYKAIQIGAVGTLHEYRNQGLSRTLMNYLIKKYQDNVDFFFLHANESVLKFYPKFGFRGVQENVFVMEYRIPDSDFSARKLNIKIESDYLLLQNLINKRQLLTKVFGAEDYGFITMWHVFNTFQNNLYYLEKENVIVIKEEKNDTLYIMDVIYGTSLNFQLVLPKLIESDSIKSINYYFPPDQIFYKYDNNIKEDSGLFVLGDVEVGNNPFRIPETALT